MVRVTCGGPSRGSRVSTATAEHPERYLSLVAPKMSSSLTSGTARFSLQGVAQDEKSISIPPHVLRKGRERVGLH